MTGIKYYSRTNIENLHPQDIILAYRNSDALENNEPELDGAIRLIHESKTGIWDVNYRSEPDGPILSGLINLHDSEILFFVSGEGNHWIGQKLQ